MNVLERIDSGIALNDDERLLVDSVKTLVREQIAPRAAEYDRTGAFPQANIDAINLLGLNAMFVPEEYGGAQLSFTCYALCVREIAKACASTGIIWATNYHAIKPLIEYGSAAQKQRFLPAIAEGALASLAITEPGAGSDATGMKTTFREDGDHIVIDGGKTFITNGDVADQYLLFIESVFAEAEGDHALRKNHLTARQAGEIARRLRAKKVVPFHFSPRYRGREETLRAELMAAWAPAHAGA